jgi:hypothetical protein
MNTPEDNLREVYRELDCATATFWRVAALVAWGFALTVLGLLAGMLIGGQR